MDKCSDILMKMNNGCTVMAEEGKSSAQVTYRTYRILCQ